MNRASCRQCGAEVIWAKHNETGKPAPLDASPWNQYGNIMIHDDGVTYQILEPEVAQSAISRKFRLYTNHLGTCPARDRNAEESSNVNAAA